MVGQKWSEWSVESDIGAEDYIPVLRSDVADNARVLASIVRGTAAGPIMLAGHSWNTPPDDVFAGIGASDYPKHDAVMWPYIFGDMVGVEPTFLTYPIRPQAANGSGAQQSTIVPIPRDGVIEHISYYPNATITGANSPTSLTHRFQAAYDDVLSFVEKRYVVNVNATQGTGVTLFELQAGRGGLKDQCAQWTDQNYQDPGLVNVRSGQVCRFVQVQVGGTGLADPGGTLVVRLGAKLRNTAMFGTLLTESGVNRGGWSTYFAQAPAADPCAGHIYCTTAANQNDTTITVSATPFPMIGVVRFANGVVASLSQVEQAGVTTLHVTALSGGIPAGTQGVYNALQLDNSIGYTPLATTILNWGLNDAVAAGDSATPDLSAWRECLRACIARALCCEVNLSNPLNIVRVNGNSGGAWAITPGQPLGGQFATNAWYFYGAVGTTTKTTATVSIDETFEGGFIDLFFYAMSSATARGGVANIILDGSVVATVDTSLVAPYAATRTLTCNTNSTTTLTATSGTFNERHDRGRALFGAGMATNGPVISTVAADGLTCTMSAAATGTSTGVSIEVCGFIPMVKRIAAAAGAHTIVIEMQSMAAGSNRASRFYFAGYGIEATDPAAAVLVANAGRVPNTGYTDTSVNNLNAQTDGVLTGTTASPALIGSNTQEPALPANVVKVDLDTVLNKQTKYWGPDAIHLNRRGNIVLANEFYKALAKLTLSQSTAR